MQRMGEMYSHLPLLYVVFRCDDIWPKWMESNLVFTFSSFKNNSSVEATQRDVPGTIVRLVWGPMGPLTAIGGEQGRKARYLD